MTDFELKIVCRVLDDNAKTSIAELTSPDEFGQYIVLKLAGDTIVHSELQLVEENNVSIEQIEHQMIDSGIPYKKEDGKLTLYINNMVVSLGLNDDGIIVLNPNLFPIKIPFSAASVVRLLQFIEDVYPFAEYLVNNKRQEVERNQKILSIKTQTLRARLDELGQKYNITEYNDMAKVDILFPSDTKLNFWVRINSITELSNRIDSIIQFYLELYLILGIRPEFHSLDKSDDWARTK